MHIRRPLSLILSLLFILSASLAPAAKKDDKSKTTVESAKPSYELPQPEKETLDLTAYQRIREEGLRYSHVMEYASALMDGIGPRLTVRVTRIDIATGAREPFRVISPADTAGLKSIPSLRLSDDGKSYAYSCDRILSDLFVVDGMK